MTNTLTRPYPHFKFPCEITIKATLLTDKQCGWYNVPMGSYTLECMNYGWFPTEVLMGVVKGKYEDTHGIGAKISGNLGTASIAVMNVVKALEMLKLKGYNIS